MKLLFVYNANSGIFSKVNDFAKKIITNNSCRLCKLTYGVFNMEKSWKDFLDSLSYEKIFMYKDEFISKYPTLKEFPAIYIDDGSLKILLNSEEINGLEDVESLIILLRKRLEF